MPDSLFQVSSGEPRLLPTIIRILPSPVELLVLLHFPMVFDESVETVSFLFNRVPRPKGAQAENIRISNGFLRFAQGASDSRRLGQLARQVGLPPWNSQK